MNVAEAATPSKTTVKRTVKPKLSEIRIEPAANGHTVHVRHSGDYMEPNGPPKGKVFEKAHGHELLRHVATKLGIRAKISEPESAAEDAGEPAEE